MTSNDRQEIVKHCADVLSEIYIQEIQTQSQTGSQNLGVATS